MIVQNKLQRLADVADYLVDPRVGIVRFVEETRREAGSPDFFHFSAQACNTRAFSRNENFGGTGGASIDREQAAAKAIGEAVERYSAALFDFEELPLASYNTATFPAVRPADFALYQPEQYEQPGFPFVPFDDDTPVRWTPMLDLATDERCYAPGAMVYIPYIYYQGTGDSPIAQPISTGVACHCSPAEAVVSALCEVIERDAFLITWQAQIAAPQIRVETLSDTNYEIVQRFERVGGEVTLFNITMEHGVPSIMATLRHREPGAAAITFAAAAEPDPEQAIRKCLEELAHTHRYCQWVKRFVPRIIPDPPDFATVTDQLTHLNFYVDQANAHFADFAFASRERIAFDEIESLATGDRRRDLKTMVERVNDAGHQVLIADLTTPDVGDLGLSVVRAVVPGFHPLHMGFNLRALGGHRLWEIPQQLGYQGITRTTGDNPAPHPFP